MTPEKFRQWIVVLFALSIATVWFMIGMKIYKWNWKIWLAAFIVGVVLFSIEFLIL